MWPCRQMLCFLFLFIICVLHVRSNDLLEIVLKTPDNTTSPTELPHKSVNVKYTIPDGDEQLNIVGIEPQIQEHQRAIELLTVRICNSIIFQTIWYDDQTTCDSTQSMLIYEWKPNYSLTPFRLPDDTAFEFTRSKTLILTVVYRREKRIHRERSGVVLYISTQPIRFKMGTMLVGHQQHGTFFSCRSSTVPRLLFGGKKLTTEKNSRWWRINIIRSRALGRKSIQPVLDSDNLLNPNHTNFEYVQPDSFFMSGDYLLLECENISQTNCYFLLYYMFKSKPTADENFCQHNDYPNLFKLLPSKEVINDNGTAIDSFDINGSTIFLTIVILLFVIWISIIIGCVIMRRIRGLVNFRTEPSSPISAQKNRLLARRGPQDNFHNRTGDADHIMQIDGEHAGI